MEAYRVSRAADGNRVAQLHGATGFSELRLAAGFASCTGQQRLRNTGQEHVTSSCFKAVSVTATPKAFTINCHCLLLRHVLYVCRESCFCLPHFPVQVTNFLHADVAMPVPRSPGSNVPFRLSLRCALNQAEVKAAPHKMLLHDAVLVSYYPRQVKIAELPLDSFRMLQVGVQWGAAHGLEM